MRGKKAIMIFFFGLLVALSACSPSNQNPQASDVPKSSSSFYFTADEGGSITKVNAETNQVVHTIKIEGTVHNVQISPDNKIVGATLVPSMGEHKEHNSSGSDEHSMKMNGYALFYDAATDSLLKKVEVGSHPAHIDFSQDGKFVLVSNYGDNDITVLDAKTYEVVQSIPTGQGPHGFRISSDSQYAYVANMDEDTVSVLNLSTLTEEKKLKVGNTPVTTAISSDGKTLIVPLHTENTAVILDLEKNISSRVAVGTGPAQVFIEPSSQHVFVANQGTKQNPSNTVSKIELSSKKVIATIQTGMGAHGLTTSSDSKYVYVTNMFEHTVSIIDNANHQVIATVPVGKSPNGITFMTSTK